jgi:hypothetical protein
MQHKWHKEIKAWADGAEIEIRFSNREEHCDGWSLMVEDCWNDDNFEFRIKPQPKEPQYLYVYQGIGELVLERSNTLVLDMNLIGKIKLEVDDE